MGHELGAWTLELSCLVLIPAVLYSGCVTLSELLNLSGPQFPHLQDGNDGTCLLESWKA